MDPSSSCILSIDPALKHIGVTWYNGASKRLLFYDIVSILTPKGKAPNMENMITIIQDMFFKPSGKYYHMVEESRIILVEQQMRKIMTVVQCIFGTSCAQLNAHYKFVAPSVVKRFFEIGKDAREKKNIKVKGSMNYAMNKKMAVEKVKQISPALYQHLEESGVKKDDVCDSLLQAVWYAKTHFSNT